VIDPTAALENVRRYAGGIVHHAARLFIAGALVSDWQVLEHQPNRLQRWSRCRVTMNRDAGFSPESTVDTGIGGEPFRHDGKLRSTIATSGLSE
jgi:hypothetical protein